MGIIIYSFNLNIAPKMLYDVLECDYCYVTELHVYDFVIKKGGALFLPGPVFLTILHLIKQ